MKLQLLKKMIAGCVGAALVMGCASCGRQVRAENLCKDITVTAVEEEPCLKTSFVESTADFSIKMFSACVKKEENLMVSPLSAMFAVSMTAEGAKGNTLNQVLDAMYNGKELEYDNLELLALRKALTKKNSAFREANSLWICDGKNPFTAEKEFLEKNKCYLGSEVYYAKFDEQTVKDINNWASKNTNGMIKQLINKISEGDAMHAINAVAFEDKWKEPYEKNQITEDEFTAADGTKKEVSYLCSTEQKYLEDEKSVGVIKPYKQGYSFVAILPNEGVSLTEYIKGMDGAAFIKKVKTAQEKSVVTMIPKFTSEYSFKANEALMGMGITDAFDVLKADFSKMGSIEGQTLYLNSMVQKTYIELDENGTKASAITDAQMSGSAEMPTEKMKQVELTRPFLYAIIHDETGLPVFLGMVTSI